MLGSTPPWAMVTWDKRRFNSSSLRMASCKWYGLIDVSLLVVAGSVVSQLKNLSGQVLHNGGEVHVGTRTDTLGVVSISEKTMNTTNGKLETSPRGTSLCLRLGLATFATTRHDESCRSATEAESETTMKSMSTAALPIPSVPRPFEWMNAKNLGRPNIPPEDGRIGYTGQNRQFQSWIIMITF